MNMPIGILVGTLFLAALLTGIVYQRLHTNKQIISLQLTRPLLTQRLGAPELDLKKSWATSLTALGALLGTILSVDRGALSSTKTNIGLNLFFGVLVLLAPVLYMATVTYVETDTKDGKGKSEPQGYLWAFLLTCLLILWAVCGELVTVMVIIFDMAAVTFFTSSITYIFLLVLIAALVCLGVYATRTIPWIVQEQLQAAKEASLDLMKGASDPELPEGELPHPSMKPWSMF